MWQLLKALIFGGTTLLTPTPIEIGHEWINLTSSKDLSAITPGATLQIEINSHVPTSMNIIDRLTLAETLFPEGCVQARLIAKDRKIISLSNVGVAASNTQTVLQLSADHGVPTDIAFSNVQLRADCEVKKVLVSWHNFSK